MDGLFYTVLNMSQTGSAVILLLLAVRLLLRKAPRKYCYALWGLAAFRLLCPVSLSLPISVFGRLYDNVDAVSQTGGGLVTVLHRTEGLSVTLTQAPELGKISGGWLDVVPVVWLVGVGALLLYALVSWFLLRRSLDNAVRLEGNVYQSDRVRSPFILGLFRPRIYIPFGLDAKTRHYVLAHERHHLKRGDHWVRMLGFGILSIHWFNPLCWVGFHYMSRDMEMRCDEAVLAREPESAKAYSTALLSVAANRRFPSPSPLAFGETGVEGRIKRVLAWKKPKAWITRTVVAVCLVVAVLWGTNPPAVNTPYPLLSTLSREDLIDTGYVSVFSEETPIELAMTEEQTAAFLDTLNRVQESELLSRSNGNAYAFVPDLCVGLTRQVEGRLDTLLVKYRDGTVWLTTSAETAARFDNRIWLLDNAALTALLENLYRLTLETGDPIS